MTPSRPRAVPGGTSALKPPQRQPLAATPARPPAADAPEELPPPPASRQKQQPREQLNTKLRIDLRARLDAFVRRHDSTLQGVVEAALDEYMARRGWSWDDYQRR